MDCSAKGLSHVGEVFYTAMKAVIYPSAPLFGPAGANGVGQIKPAAINALNRVFMLCDRDRVTSLTASARASRQCSCSRRLPLCAQCGLARHSTFSGRV